MATTFKVEVEGLKDVLRSIAELGDRRVLPAARRALYRWGEETITIAKDEFVPVEFGILKGSGQSELKEEGNKLFVELSFGKDSPASEYAMYVHEVPAIHTVGEDKYLEKPALRESAHLVEDIKRTVMEAIR